MADPKRAERAADRLTRIARSGHDLDRLRIETFDAVRKVVPFDAAFWTISDPATLLFTRGVQDGIPSETAPRFLENEFGGDDFNRFVEVAADPDATHSLHVATEGDLSRSARYRDILEPIGLGDELRIAFSDRSGVWGFVCIHRERGAPAFSEDEASFLRRAAPVVATGIRTAILIAASQTEGDHPAVPGLVLLSEDLSFVGSNAAGDAWLERLGDDRIEGVPAALYGAAAALRGDPDAEPSVRTLTPTGWAAVRPSWMDVGGERHIALLIEEPSAVELAPLIVSAYGLTPQQSKIVELICRGSSTADITVQLHISPHTVQDHLKAIFTKMGVSNRRELVASLLSGHYMPRAMSLEPINRRGQFDR